MNERKKESCIQIIKEQQKVENRAVTTTQIVQQHTSTDQW